MKALLIISFSFLSLISLAQSRTELEKKRTLLLKEISETENILNTVKQSKSESLEKLSLLDKKISLRNSLIVNLSSEVSNCDKKIIELERTTQSLDVDIRNIKAEYARMIYLSYLNRFHSDPLMFILSSEGINQAYKRIKYLQQYSDYRKKQIAVINGVQTSFNNQIKELENRREEKIKLITAQEAENRTLQSELKEKTQTVNVLKLKENELSKKLKAQSTKAEKLAKEIDRIIKAEIVARSSAEKAAKKVFVADNHLSKVFKENMGKLPWPIDQGVITRGFGRYRDPVYKNVEIESQGIDISTLANSDVHAIFEGEVSDKFVIPGFNYAVIINHGKFYTVYQNLVDVHVKKGDKVRTRQVIGKVATDSESKSSILHVQIWDQLKVLDPEAWLSRN